MDRFSISYFLIITFLLSACSSSYQVNYDKPEEIYKSALRAVKNKDFEQSTELLSELKTRHPQSRFSSLADLRLADAHYGKENFLQAATLYRSFVELYPRHELADYAQYRMANSYLKDAPSNIARDQKGAQYASASAINLQRKYPKSKYAKEAQGIYLAARLKQAKKEAYIARFYEKIGKKQSAAFRWKRIASNYEDLKDFKEASALLQEAQKKEINN